MPSILVCPICNLFTIREGFEFDIVIYLSGSSGQVGAEKNYAASFRGHLFMIYFYRAGGMAPWSPWIHYLFSNLEMHIKHDSVWLCLAHTCLGCQYNILISPMFLYVNEMEYLFVYAHRLYSTSFSIFCIPKGACTNTQGRVFAFVHVGQ